MSSRPLHHFAQTLAIPCNCWDLRVMRKCPLGPLALAAIYYSSLPLGYSPSSKFSLLCRPRKRGTTGRREATSTEQQPTKAAAHRQGIRPENKGCSQRGKPTQVLWWAVSLSLPLLLPRSSGRSRVRTREAGRSRGGGGSEGCGGGMWRGSKNNIPE